MLCFLYCNKIGLVDNLHKNSTNNDEWIRDLVILSIMRICCVTLFNSNNILREARSALQGEPSVELNTDRPVLSSEGETTMSKDHSLLKFCHVVQSYIDNT